MIEKMKKINRTKIIYIMILMKILKTIMILRMIISTIQIKCLKNRFKTEFQNSNELILIEYFLNNLF